MSQWVQHISGQGEKWEVVADTSSEDEWCVVSKFTRHHCHFLPKSEYILVEPAHVWEDVTGDLHVGTDGRTVLLGPSAVIRLPEDFRAKKLVMYAYNAGVLSEGLHERTSLILERLQS